MSIQSFSVQLSQVRKWLAAILLCSALWGCGLADLRLGDTDSDDFDRLERIDPIPAVQAFIREERYADADAYLAFFMDYEYVSEDPQAQKLTADIDSKRRDWKYRLEKINQGFFTGNSDEPDGQAASLLSDFLVVGDLRDLAKEVNAYVDTGEIDKINAALAGIGVGMSIATIPGPGLAPAKGGVSFLKYMNRSVGLPRWLRELIIASSKEPARLFEFFRDVFSTYKSAGTRSTMYLLSKARSLDDFRLIMRMGKQYGTKTAALLKITDGAAVDLFRKNGSVPREVLLEAGTYGKAGIEKLEKLGPEKFVEGFVRRLSKVELDFIKSGTAAKVAGKQVVYRNQTFLKNSVDGTGLTNLERMRRGLAPLGKDGMPVELHHLKQRDAGTIVEMTRTEHRRDWSPLIHRYSRQSEIKRPDFNEWRMQEYWKWRAANYER